MNLHLQNKVAMVAAASKGIGRAIAESLCSENVKISICSRNLENINKVKSEILAQNSKADVLAVQCDVSSALDLKRWYSETLKKFGRIDILVTNTGGPPAGFFKDTTDEQWHSGFESTLMNIVRLCRLVLPDMQKQKWGRIVHITSLAAKQPIDILPISNTLRAGISALTKTLSNQYARHNITMNTLLPGYIDTDRVSHLNEVKAAEQGISVAEFAAQVCEKIPAGRNGKTQEIGDVVTFLCSENAAYLNGASIQVDGGLIQSTF